ncbi:MAG TPA: Smr/MutS family protein [Flavobacteriaceae bacterium]|nr:Smr/MutS family protein [Flavobacteriaceae bacterium]
MKIKKGDWVEVIDDTISGIVVEVEDNRITIETEDGFPLSFFIDEVVKNEGFSLDRKELEKAIKEEQKELKSKKIPSGKKRAKEKPLEVDLHIEELTSSTKNMSDFQILNLQLDNAQGQLEFAIRKKIRRVVFIHGVGKGVLRQELETLFRRYDQIEFYDADFKEYGRGATEVYIYQNKKK